MTLTLDDLRAVAHWAADCAARVLPIFEAKRPKDRRPREAIEGAREFARGGKRTARLRVLSLSALAAARDAKDKAAQAAARSACLAASSAYTHPLPTTDQARHILGPAVYAALARERARDRELNGAVRRATPALLDVLRRFPAQRTGRTQLAILFQQLDQALRRC